MSLSQNAIVDQFAADFREAAKEYPNLLHVAVRFADSKRSAWKELSVQPDRYAKLNWGWQGWGEILGTSPATELVRDPLQLRPLRTDGRDSIGALYDDDGLVTATDRREWETKGRPQAFGRGVPKNLPGIILAYLALKRLAPAAVDRFAAHFAPESLGAESEPYDRWLTFLYKTCRVQPILYPEPPQPLQLTPEMGWIRIPDRSPDEADGHSQRRPWGEFEVLRIGNVFAASAMALEQVGQREPKGASRGGKTDEGGRRTKRGARPRVTINERMSVEIARNPDANGWTIDQWMTKLSCSRGGIHGTKMWRMLQIAHARVAVERELKTGERTDRRRFNKKKQNT